MTPERVAHKAPLPRGRSGGHLHLGGRCAGHPSGGLLRPWRGAHPGGHFVAATLAEPGWPEPATAAERIGRAGGLEGKSGRRFACRRGAGTPVPSKAARWVPGRRGLRPCTSPPEQVAAERSPVSWDSRRAPRRRRWSRVNWSRESSSPGSPRHTGPRGGGGGAGRRLRLDRARRSLGRAGGRRDAAGLTLHG